jgi:hypothetical protein
MILLLCSITATVTGSTMNQSSTMSPSSVSIMSTGPLPTPFIFSVTSPPMPACSLQNEDPDQGINARGCICGSVTLPLLTITPEVDESSSCSYTAMPSSSTSNPITIGTQSWTSNCQACTLVGGIADEAQCTSVGGCVPTTQWLSTTTYSNGRVVAYDQTTTEGAQSTTLTAGSSITVQMNPTSSVAVGSMIGDEISTSISSALATA